MKYYSGIKRTNFHTGNNLDDWGILLSEKKSNSKVLYSNITKSIYTTQNRDGEQINN